MSAVVFDWDDENTHHIDHHDVLPDGVEDAFADPDRIPATAHRGPRGQPRRAFIGATEEGRVMQPSVSTSSMPVGCAEEVLMTRPMRRKNLVPVNDPNEIPAFETEGEEHEFWKTHELGPGMFENVEPDPLLEQISTRPRGERTRPVPVRFDADTLRRLRTLAARKGTGYQTLLKTFVMERLYEEEKREGIIGG